ncbi:MAG: rhodanese-like domain-containing protein [Deltaproteobacteria bacterium]|jgi:hypothetical protein|nr:rhodanese-like domain-containing protein [Deltaproteobacteria bacterium]MBT7483422.1 rhodanese-like domain-containing protein [Candidatus Peregrinibacteria bacterium]MBT4089933.1 rhodanese-like domain-containing protein [Deltaproteobacteria bacterium]MBT4268624.1 rhodanese-like domain-containing protein [Deltaproteobacteria bacterium]MBT4642705.1 rhodanese-like domain-containing protein [Deltaproteobacteria bacterium]
MIKKTFQLAIAIAVVTLMLPSGAMADKIVGVVKSISNKAKMVELDVKGKTVTIPFNKSTKFVPNKKTIKPKFKVIVEFDKNGPAKLIKAKLVKLPKGVTEAKVADVKALLASGKGILIDSRPAKPYGMNHIHGAISIPVSEMKKRMAELGTDKNIQLIFYCGGVT